MVGREWRPGKHTVSAGTEAGGAGDSDCAVGKGAGQCWRPQERLDVCVCGGDECANGGRMCMTGMCGRRVWW